MPKVSEAHREARRDEILAAALRAFSVKGYQRTSMADVIAESGLSAGAIYGHFDGKRELFLGVIQGVLGQRREELAEAIRQGPPPSPGEALTVLVRGMVGSGVDVRLLVQIWGEATIEPEIRQIVDEAAEILKAGMTDALRAWFTAHPDRAPGGVDAAVTRLLPVMIALGQGFMLQRVLFDDFDDEAYLETVRDVLPH